MLCLTLAYWYQYDMSGEVMVFHKIVDFIRFLKSNEWDFLCGYDGLVVSSSVTLHIGLGKSFLGLHEVNDRNHVTLELIFLA